MAKEELLEFPVITSYSIHYTKLYEVGRIATVTPELGGAFTELMGWADRLRVLQVRTNADTPQDAIVAREFGAEGIGLCRTEHMFFEPGRITVITSYSIHYTKLYDSIAPRRSCWRRCASSPTSTRRAST